jgi:uncharacterized protein YndB with AHSA1/START domain
MENYTADGIYIEASAERVFAALGDPHEALVWLDATEARIAPASGGEFSARREDGSSLQGIISEFNPPLRLVVEDLSWKKEGQERGKMRLQFELIPRDTGIWINIRQDGLDSGDAAGEWEDFAREVRRDLIQYTLRLKRHIEGI